MAAKLDPAMLKLIQKEIVAQMLKTSNTSSDVDDNLKKKIELIEVEMKKNQEILKKSGLDVMKEKGWDAGKQHVKVAQPEAKDRIAELDEKKKNFVAELDGLQEKFRKEIEAEKAILKQIAKDTTKSDLGVSDVKVLTKKVATLEKIVKALMAASKTGAKAAPGGSDVAVDGLQEQLAAQDKKIEEFAKMHKEMFDKSLKRIEVTEKLIDDGVERDVAVGSKVVPGEVDDPVKYKILEDNLKRMEEEKKLLQDSIKVVQSKQESRKKEIEEAVAAAEAKLEKERKEREKLRAEQLKKIKKDTDASVKKAMEDMQKNVLESRLKAIEDRLAAKGG